jgi:hypothetical protein
VRVAIKIVGWTLGMTLAVYLITEGKGMTEHALEHALIGATIGLILGCLFSRNLKKDKPSHKDLSEFSEKPPFPM